MTAHYRASCHRIRLNSALAAAGSLIPRAILRVRTAAKVRCVRRDTSRSDSLPNKTSSSDDHAHFLGLQQEMPNLQRCILIEPAG